MNTQGDQFLWVCLKICLLQKSLECLQYLNTSPSWLLNVDFQTSYFHFFITSPTATALVQSLQHSTCGLHYFLFPPLLILSKYFNNLFFSCITVIDFNSRQSHSPVRIFVTTWTAACQTFLPITNSWSLLLLMFIESVMQSIHLILCRLLPLLPSIFPSIRVFSNESVLHIRWPKCCSFSFSIILPMNIRDWFPLRLTGLISLQSKGLSVVFSNTTVQKHQLFSTQLSLYTPTLTSTRDYWKNHSFDSTDLCQQSIVSAF